MGTRNLTMVVHKGQIKVAQYGQWDGYPTGVGSDVAEFVQTLDRSNASKFRKALDECTFLSEADLAKTDVTESPEFSRDTGAGILSLIQINGVRELADSSDFTSESLFCEWAYLVDMDKRVVEVYKGFNKKPLSKTARFAGPASSDGYYPIKLLKKYKFSEFTPDAMKALEDKLNKKRG